RRNSRRSPISMSMRRAIGSTRTIPTTTGNGRKPSRPTDSRRAWKFSQEAGRDFWPGSRRKAVISNGSNIQRRSETMKAVIRNRWHAIWIHSITVVVLGSIAFPWASARAAIDQARVVKYSKEDIVSVNAKLRFSTLIVLPEDEEILDFTTGDKE